MQASADQYLQPGGHVQAVAGAPTASQWPAALSGVFGLPGSSRCRTAGAAATAA